MVSDALSLLLPAHQVRNEVTRQLKAFLAAILLIAGDRQTDGIETPA